MDNDVTRYLNTDELYHYGVKGMKWGVRRYRNEDGSLTDAGRKRDAKLEAKSNRYSNKATYEAVRAYNSADQGMNGSSSLARSDRYLKKATKLADKMSDSGNSVKSGSDYITAMGYNEVAGKKYVKRTMGQKTATLVTTTAVSLGGSFMAFQMGAPIAFIYASTGGKYDLKQ